tara:strand:- start:135 stop:899 length:765 start_codon:yes stop_codon:yes gene_type:complete
MRANIKRNYIYLRHLGIRQFIKYLIAPNKALLKVKLFDKNIYIRKNTPDLIVSISSLGNEFKCLRYLLPSDYDGLIVDAGAYIGTASLALHDLYPDATIVAIEPSSSNLNVLKKNISQFNNIKIRHSALASVSGKVINLNDRSTGEWGFTLVKKPHDKVDAYAMEKIKTTSLKELIKDLSAKEIGILKLDIEGGEMDLFENSLPELENAIVIFAELHERIIPGVEEKFLQISKKRILIKDDREKFLSIRPQNFI